jgi:parallel beta-helix repeat protein
MAGITHEFVSAIGDDSDVSIVRPSNWNAGHVDSAGNAVGFAPICVAASNATAAEKSYALLTGGAVCDGTADNVELQAAMTGLSGGGTILLSTGTFNLAAGIQPHGNQRIVGQGESTIITQPNSTNLSFLWVVGNYNNTVFENFVIDGNIANQGSGVALVYFTASITNHTIKNCTLKNGTRAVEVGSPGTITGLYFYENQIYGCTNNQINLSGDTTHILNDIDISNNVINNVGGAMGIVAIYAQKVNISHNRITGDTATLESINVGSCSQVTIVDNICSYSGDGGIVVYGCASGDHPSGITVHGNIVEYMDLDGIVVLIYSGTDIKNVVVTGNICRNCGQSGAGHSGIYLDTVTDTVITENRCYDDQVTKTQDYGIIEVNTCDYNIILGNDCRGNDSDGIVKVGANDVFDHNLE